MPQYKVLEPGFYDGILYKPNHPRNHTVRTDAPLKKVPSWLKLIKGETAAGSKARRKAEADQAKADADKAKQDKVDVDSVTFTESPKSAGVETL